VRRAGWPWVDCAVAAPDSSMTQSPVLTATNGNDARLFAQAELLDSLEQAVIATDAQGRITYWNPFAERLYGWNAQEVLGRNIQDVTPAQMSAEQAASIMARLLAGESWAGEFLVQRRDGSSFPAHVTDTPIKDADGRVIGVVGASFDLTDRKRIEEDLAAALEREKAASQRATESLALLDVLVSSAPVGIVFFDRDLRYVRINQELADMNGLPVEAHLGRTVREVVPGLADKAELILRRVLDTGQAVRDLLLVGETRKAPGVVRTWRESYYPIHGADGQIIGVGAIALEVTEQQELEAQRDRLLNLERAARAEAEAQRIQLAQVLDLMPEAVLIADAASRTFLLSNRASVRLLGTDVAGQSVPVGSEPAYGSRKFDGTPIAADELRLQRALRGEAVTGAQYLHHQVGQDRDIPVLVNSTPLRDGQGSVVGAICVFQDISTLRELEQQKDDFLATASHDLQQPLAVIKGRAQLLGRRLAVGEPIEAARLQETLTTIQRTVDEMTQQVRELLDAARLQLGRQLDLERQAIDLVPLVRDTVESWATASPHHAVQFEAALTTLPCSVDPHRLRRVFANLLSNAVKYSPEGSTVTVRVWCDRAMETAPVAVIDFHDEGLGIPAAELPRIFEPFFRAANADRAAGGAGIGLAGARRIVEQHAGTIAVRSIEGQGSTFSVRLPMPRGG
jgi:PAS domain S-box-containing protein